MARILLVKCSQYEGVLSAFSYPLGLMYLAARLRRERVDHEVRIHDLRTRDENYDELRDVVNSYRPDLVGLSAITVEASSMARAAAAIRASGFDGPVIAGGPHPTAFPEESLACADMDLLVLEEGEETFAELVREWSRGGDLHRVPGVAFRNGAGIGRSPARPFIRDLDSIPLPAWDLVDVGEYSQFKSMSGIRSRPRFANLLTSRACPYNCTYCLSIFGKKFRPRSPENVLEEVRLLVDRHDVGYIEIIDDVFNHQLDRAKRIFDLIQAEGLPVDVAFPNGLRCDTLDREFLEKLACFDHALICVPVESASPRIQRMIRKNLDLAKVSWTIDTCADLGIYTRGYFMLGFPGETEAELKATVDFAVRSRLHAAFFFVVVPFKGTELYDTYAKELGQRGYRHEDHDYFRGPMNLSAVSDETLFQIQKWAYVRMAASPSRIARVFRDFPNRRFVWPAVKTGIELFRGAGKGHKPGRPDLIPGASRRPTGY